eukprot:gene10707-22356_t
MGGYPIQLFIEGKITENNDLICSICMDVFKDPTQCPSGHLFCRTCIVEVLKKSASCPICRAVLTVESLCANLFVKNFISKMSIQCSTAILNENNPIESNCQWKGTLAALEEHTKSCEFVEIGCANNGCKIKIPRREMTTHSTLCQYRRAICTYCEVTFQAFELQGHLTICPEKPLLCSNEGCDAIVLPINMDKHKGECLWEKIDCPLNLIGACSGQCPRNLLRKDLESHLSSSSTICASIQALVGLKRKAEMIQDELTASKKENQILKETITKENQVIQESLTSTNANLAQVVAVSETTENRMNSIENNSKEIKFQIKAQTIYRHLQNNSNLIYTETSNTLQRWLSLIDIGEGLGEFSDDKSLDVFYHNLITLFSVVRSAGRPYCQIRYIAVEIPYCDLHNLKPYTSDFCKFKGNATARIRIVQSIVWNFMVEIKDFK